MSLILAGGSRRVSSRRGVLRAAKFHHQRHGRPQGPSSHVHHAAPVLPRRDAPHRNDVVRAERRLRLVAAVAEGHLDGFGVRRRCAGRVAAPFRAKRKRRGVHRVARADHRQGERAVFTQERRSREARLQGHARRGAAQVQRVDAHPDVSHEIGKPKAAFRIVFFFFARRCVALRAGFKRGSEHDPGLEGHHHRRRAHGVSPLGRDVHSDAVPRFRFQRRRDVRARVQVGRVVFPRGAPPRVQRVGELHRDRRYFYFERQSPF
mmetsp:Transcript_10833/g.46140  ORF Transcript_10833/g.46140 Transcript_10833/m.46140 type:complete len:263 (-) Transcript_10833:1582-2370(-)